MTFTLAQTLDLLERTPAVLFALLQGISPDLLHGTEGSGTWSPFEVVGHLVHAEETNWLPRARHLLESGGKPFEPFDRYAHLVRFSAWSLEDLLTRFAALRQASLETARGWNLTEAQLALKGHHPELGAVTLQELLATWAVHDLAHTGQIVRVLAGQYAEAVGPWRAYLSILGR